jgi:hypothetical protein
MTNPTEATTVVIKVPGAIAGWLIDFGIAATDVNYSTAENEWRHALVSAPQTRAGRGVVYTLTLTPEAAKEMAVELSERATMERGLIADVRQINPVTVDRFVAKVRTATP